MANRRMIMKSMSVNPNFNSVSEFARLLYLMTTPHCDDFGKLDGDPVVVKALVMPLSERPVQDFEKALQELEEKKFVDWYEVNDQRVIRQTTFEEDQTGLDKRTRSKYPDKDSENFPEVLRNSPLTKPNRTESNLKEPTETKGDNIFSDIASIKEEDLLDISQGCGVSVEFVEKQYDKMLGYCASSGMEYNNYKAALIKFVQTAKEKGGKYDSDTK